MPVHRLPNFGNTCYANSVIQVLLNTPILNKKWEGQFHSVEQHNSLPIFVKALTFLFSKKSETGVSENQDQKVSVEQALMYLLKDIAPHMNENGLQVNVQNDPCEFTTFLFELLHSVTCKLKKMEHVFNTSNSAHHNYLKMKYIKTIMEQPYSYRDYDHPHYSKIQECQTNKQLGEIISAYFKSHKSFKQIDLSIRQPVGTLTQIGLESTLSNIFRCIIYQRISCLHCDHFTEQFELTKLLIVELKSTVHESLESYFTGDKIDDYQCENCKEKGTASIRRYLLNSPPVLILVMRRFVASVVGQSRIHRKLNNPIGITTTLNGKMLYRLGSNIENENYELYGLVNHWGSLHGGHCTSTVYDEATKKWLHVDDNNIAELVPDKHDQYFSTNSKAYMLFYNQVK